MAHVFLIPLHENTLAFNRIQTFNVIIKLLLLVSKHLSRNRFFSNFVTRRLENSNRFIKDKYRSMNVAALYEKALNFEFLSVEEGVYLFENAPLTELMYVANELRKKQVPHGKVTWQIDRNVNTTNVCIANCKFCNFYRIPGMLKHILQICLYTAKKIEETFKYGGDQLLLQGGHHPQLGLDFYTNTFRQIKQEYPNIKLHALGPPEVAHITKLEKNPP